MTDIEKLMDNNQARAREEAAYAAGIRWAVREANRKKKLRELTHAFWLTNVLTGAVAVFAALNIVESDMPGGIATLLLVFVGLVIAARLEELADAYR